MYTAWTTSADNPDALARSVEAHLNEFAGEVISVSYAVHAQHHALVVYRAIEITEESVEEAIAVAEHIIDGAHG